MNKFNAPNKFFAAVLMMLTFGLSTFSANASLMLSFDLDNNDLAQGDAFSVELLASTDTDISSEVISAWGLDLNFDSNILSLDSLLVGPAFMPVNNDGDGLGGLVPFGQDALSGANILLATLNFTAIGSGTTDLFTSSTFGDFNEGFYNSFFQPVGYSDATTSITVSGGSEVPEPGALLLMLLATAALVTFRKKA
ncbi:PEP-CTERM sorting domain-containing protein [Thalassomonas viridans]|uniref:PEP-CTERM sorting domain-containing protein n=1 Tax=Thalassomonas viridans TaxID=137584 RepID=A0AAF0C9R8_9GAMM|nr:cohesin domain-containing protein [Thalassomonas viridans]WDE06088.1 PEP-CTERM sorting domain-containing protein [Thalassomonas viridans]